MNELNYNRFQRKGASSNSKVGSEFETKAKVWLKGQGIDAVAGLSLDLGFKQKKSRRFDLGTHNPPTIVECKSHRWTETDNMPSAKVTVWNEAMLYFSLAPSGFRKILFVLKDISMKRNETLAHYYLRTHANLIPTDVEIWEYDDTLSTAERLN